MEVQADLTVLVAATGDEARLRRFLRFLVGGADHVGLEVLVALPEPIGNIASLRDEFRDIVWIGRDRNRPPGEMINAALRRACGRYFSLWDDTVVVADGCLATLIDFLDEVPEAAIVGPKLRDQEGRIQRVARTFPPLLSLLSSSAAPPGRPAPGWGEYASGEANWFAGPGMMISRIFIDDEGGVHPRLSGWLWQLEICRRAVRAGWHVHYLHEAQATGSQRNWLDAMGGERGGGRRLWEWLLLLTGRLLG
ncbi:MAG: hypothetical protein ACOY4H_00005 [Thermodesulfobacteriota bacterium]